jgi:hypothetical protein
MTPMDAKLGTGCSCLKRSCVAKHLVTVLTWLAACTKQVETGALEGGHCCLQSLL